MWSDGEVGYSLFYKPHFIFLNTSPPFCSLLLLSPELSLWFRLAVSHTAQS